ncbi:growth hormone-inducible transmembrane protein-like [Paramacrobiotus metropolitanus]|uniref:growth hormone-inducible transmembrane protein-like n=1 Tax=Paramacrobiotus metropolitanus TaxID=2943436 RepID=UPI0024458F99|nr:growth hormone-inducible transmembrane protein-like [Paramacrobiotus metropolitanus]
MSLFRLSCSSLVPRAILRAQIRNMAEEAPRMRRADVMARQRVQEKPLSLKERLMAPAGETAFGIGQAALAGGAAFGIGALCYYGLGLSKQTGLWEKSYMWPEYVRTRVHETYAYLGGSLGVTAISTYLVSRSPQLMSMMTRTGWMSILLTFGAMIGTGMLARSIAYENTGPKHLAWLLHAATIGAVIAPLTLLGGPIMMRAAMYTAGIVGGLSTVAACAPSDKFLYMGGGLAIGLGVVFAASLGSMFLPPTTAIGAGLYSISMYGGLLLFSAFLLYDTQRVVRKAETHPPGVPGMIKQYDPINAMMSIYMDIINIFIRLAVMMGGGNRRR